MTHQFLESLFSLKGKTAVITGGGGILCEAIAGGYLAAEATVYLVDIDGDRVVSAAGRLNEKGLPGRAHAVRCDILDGNDLEHTCGEILGHSGGIDILVNGAGGNHPSATTDPGGGTGFFDLPEDGIRKTLDLNLTGTVLCCRAFGRVMAEWKSGSVINIASMSGITPLTRVPAYSAAKAAVMNFTKWLAVDLARNHSAAIRVNAIAPGFFHTKQNHFLLFKEGGDEEELTGRGRAVIDATPQKRFGRGDDLVGAALWLASDGAAFVTGTVITVDGGFSAFSGV